MEGLPAAKEPQKKKAQLSAVEARKQSKAKELDCLVLKGAMNNLKKALDDLLHPEFIFTML